MITSRKDIFTYLFSNHVCIPSFPEDVHTYPGTPDFPRNVLGYSGNSGMFRVAEAGFLVIFNNQSSAKTLNLAASL